MASRLGDRVRWWMTHNEPFCTAINGYGIGVHAPGLKDYKLVGTVGHNVLLSHGLALPRIRQHLAPGSEVGITLNFTPPYAADTVPTTLERVAQLKREDRWFVEPLLKGQYPAGLFADFGAEPANWEPGDMALIAAPIDFLGINYYTRSLWQASADGRRAVQVDPVPGSLYNDLHWEVYPDALRDLIIWLHREYAPSQLYVTENGFSYGDVWDGGNHIHDPERTKVLHQHLTAVGEAIQSGAPLRGYFAWSLLDNYEWHDGYSKRFGVVYVDYPTQRRIVKDSGLWYANFIHHQHTRPIP